MPCSADVQRTWLVETSAEAQALVSAVNCSGGLFEVEWSGHIVIDQAIYIADGTVLTIRGDGLSAVVDGKGLTRLFTVIDATLHVIGVNITSGKGTTGGAIATAGSTLTLTRTSLIGNRATGNAGAVYISDGSSLSCSDVSFINNSAADVGGAVYVTDTSVVSCGGLWLNNTAGVDGGALSVGDGSRVSWAEQTIFAHNKAGEFGGALIVYNSSSVSWSVSSSFFANSADMGVGGAIFVVFGSSVSWNATTIFDSNDGGAVGAQGSSNVLWSGAAVTKFNGNTGDLGGAIRLNDYSHLSCAENTTTSFTSNLAITAGGAVALELGSSAVFGGDVSFDGNIAAGIPDTFESGFGGAVVVFDGSSVAWHRDLNFTRNSAEKLAGALYVADSSVSWTGSTNFAGNIAGLSAGALFLWNGSHVEWTGNTHFTSNEAGGDGGAVGSPILDSDYNRQSSKLVVNGSTAFTNNTSGANGGALSLLGGLSVSIIEKDVVFLGNKAKDAGGAIYVSGTGVGPEFADIRFISNSAQVGGAASVVASGTLKQVNDTESPNPTTFDGCLFFDNRATATGGAIESAGGEDLITNNVFEGNKAGVGGALRLASMASVKNCSFVENISDGEEGAALSNIGSLSSVTDILFSGNTFSCQQGMFLDFQASFPSWIRHVSFVGKMIYIE